MEKSTFIQTYLLTFAFCLSITIGLILMMKKGLKKFFENLSQDNDIANFFVKLTNIIILLAGIGAALKSGYQTDEKSNWLTLIWDSAAQAQESLGRLFLTLIILAVTFFILHLVARRVNK